MTLIELLIIMILSLLSGLDRTALVQIMIARPIIVAPLTGWVLGMPLAGLQVGLALELLFIARLPVGATVPPDDTQMALSATLLTVLASRWNDVPLTTALLFGVLVALALGYVGGKLDQFVRKSNTKLVEQAKSALEQEAYARVVHLHRKGILHFGLASLATSVLISSVGALLLWFWGGALLPKLTPVAAGTLLILPLVGIAALLAQHRGRFCWTLVGLGFAASFLWLQVAS